MEKLKRIRKWICLQEICNSSKLKCRYNYSHICNNNNNDNKMTSSILTTAATTTTTKTAQPHSPAQELPNWSDVQLNETSDRTNKNSNNNNNNITNTTVQRNSKSTNTSNHQTRRFSRNYFTTRNVKLQGLTKWTVSLKHNWLVLCVAIFSLQNFTILANEINNVASTKPMQLNTYNLTAATTTTMPTTADWRESINGTATVWQYNVNLHSSHNQTKVNPADDSIFLRFANRFSTGNELWDGIISDCYKRPTFSCFQKNVYAYLNDALEVNDVNITQRLKFFKNQFNFEQHGETTEAAVAMDHESEEETANENDEHLLNNAIPHVGRAAAESPIEEVTNALYGKSLKFAMTHDIEMQLPEMMFDGATFRISPRSFEGNGIIAKLEFIPKQEVQARLAGKIIMKKIQKFLRSKLLLSFLALVLIIKIIKIKLFWLLPIVIGVGAAKKLLLKFLLFLFPALSHLFKLCSYYQQTYHSTKYHHHHHLINHHHTVLPSWHGSGEHHSIPEIIYTNPPKGHPSAYLHGAPIHETYGPPSHEHYDGWENSGPGLGSEYISDINRAAQVDENSNFYNPNPNDASELHAWGLGTTQPSKYPQQQRQPTNQKQTTLSIQQPQFYKKPQVTSHNFNPFLSPEKQSLFNVKYKNPTIAQSAPSPVYVPPRNQLPQSAKPQQQQYAAQYDPIRNNNVQQLKLVQQQQQQQQQLTPELSAQLKETIRVQAENRLIQQQQKILEKQPFVLDGGQPLMPLNYDPFYSPILLKIDKIIEQLGITDELCKERLVCSMYKDPQRYSPHSNFVSAELSRETSELQQSASTNEAVVRFHRLIQAARDGQDQRDCLSLYSHCNINTE